MALTVKIDTRTKAAKRLVDYLKTLSFVQIEEKSHYDPDFVEKIKKSKEEFERGEYTRVENDDLNKFLGLEE